MPSTVVTSGISSNTMTSSAGMGNANSSIIQQHDGSSMLYESYGTISYPSTTRTDDCEASGEASETDSIPQSVSDTSDGQTDSVATCCMQGSTTISYGDGTMNSNERIGGSAEPMIPGMAFGNSHQSLNMRVMMSSSTTTSRRHHKSERPWSVSCLSQLTSNESGHILRKNVADTINIGPSNGLASHSISESALDSLTPPNVSGGGGGCSGVTGNGNNNANGNVIGRTCARSTTNQIAVGRSNHQHHLHRHHHQHSNHYCSNKYNSNCNISKNNKLYDSKGSLKRRRTRKKRMSFSCYLDSKRSDTGSDDMIILSTTTTTTTISTITTATPSTIADSPIPIINANESIKTNSNTNISNSMNSTSNLSPMTSSLYMDFEERFLANASKPYSSPNANNSKNVKKIGNVALQSKNEQDTNNPLLTATTYHNNVQHTNICCNMESVERNENDKKNDNETEKHSHIDDSADLDEKPKQKDRDDGEMNLMKPNFRVGSFTTAYMTNEARLGSLAALATLNINDDDQQGKILRKCICNCNYYS